jgi:O-antigen ligase
VRTVALVVLAGLAIASPWPFGSVQPDVARGLGILALAAALACGATAAVRGGPGPAEMPVRALVALLLVGAFQLVPLPSLLHRLAPGSRAAWHPAEPAALAVLGAGPHPISLDPDATRSWLGFCAGLVALCVLAAGAGARPLKRAAVAAVAGTLAVALYGVVARSLFGPLLFGSIAVPTISPFGPFVSKNHFAGYVEMGALLALGLAVGLADREGAGGRLSWTASPRAWRVLAAAAASLAMAASVLASFSRGGALSVVAGFLAFAAARAWIRRRRGRGGRPVVTWTIGAVLLATALALALPRAAHERLGSLAAGPQEGAVSFRVRTWSDAGRMAAASPWLGHGLGAFATAFPRYKRGDGELRVEHAENDYLEMLAEAGVLGLGLSLFVVAASARRILAGLLRQEDRLMRGLGLGALSGMIALLVHSAFDFNLRIPANATLFSLLAALAFGASRGDSHRPVRAAAPGFVLLPALGLLAILWPRTPATLGSARGDLAAAHATPDPVARGLRLARADLSLAQVVRRRPADGEAWLLLGWGRALRGRDDGLPLARHGASLDPSRAPLQAAVERLASELAAAR